MDIHLPNPTILHAIQNLHSACYLSHQQTFATSLQKSYARYWNGGVSTHLLHLLLSGKQVHIWAQGYTNPSTIAPIQRIIVKIINHIRCIQNLISFPYPIAFAHLLASMLQGLQNKIRESIMAFLLGMKSQTLTPIRTQYSRVIGRDISVLASTTGKHCFICSLPGRDEAIAWVIVRFFSVHCEKDSKYSNSNTILQNC